MKCDNGKIKTNYENKITSLREEYEKEILEMKNEKEVMSKDYQLDIEKLNSEIKYGKHELLKLKDEYEKRIEKMRLQWIKMIAERIHYLEAYLKIITLH